MEKHYSSSQIVRLTNFVFIVKIYHEAHRGSAFDDIETGCAGGGIRVLTDCCGVFAYTSRGRGTCGFAVQ